MCGIAGFIETTGWPIAHSSNVVARMASTLEHRGPDDAGVWVGPGGVALGHRRLSIVDLSPAGHQPMTSKSGRYVIAFNGEIYNHRELRTQIDKSGAVPSWRGHSDTETLLAGFEVWGIERTLELAVGMFAIALWDQRQHSLHLMRDRFGEKPLYYGWVAGSFVFGSELKALRMFPGFNNTPCRLALGQYLRFMYVPAPRSIFAGIYKLEPGCMLSVHGKPAKGAPNQPLRPDQSYEGTSIERWWALSDTVERGAANPFNDEREAIDALDRSVSDAVRLQSLADVPLGAFLSGGVDSSLIAATMQKQSSRAIKTFTVGFEEGGFDESPYASAVAQHLHTDHTRVFVSAREAQATIPELPRMYDEPFADSSQIPTHLVSRAAKQHVTVALSGDAGDELFGGYNRYFWGPRVWNKVAWLPYTMRRSIGQAIHCVPIAAWDACGSVAAKFAGSRSVSRLGDKAHKMGTRLHYVRRHDDLYESLVSEWQDPMSLLQGEGANLQEPPSLLADPLPGRGVGCDQLRMMYRDSMSYLPDDILCKVDRAAMAVSLETRVPFLDHRVAEIAWRLPLDMKIRGSQGKWALRQVLYRYVPPTLIERPKAGFALPVGQWLRGPLRAWAEEMLSESRVAREGYFQPEPIRRIWQEHLSGKRDWTPRLWSVLMFNAWLEVNG